MATVACNKCGVEYTGDISSITLKFQEEFREYENLYFRCPNCPTVEGFNMNLPLDELDDEIPTYEMPVEEEIQRYYVRLAMRIVREDLKQSPAV